jgi:hypothetical protein
MATVTMEDQNQHSHVPLYALPVSPSASSAEVVVDKELGSREVAAMKTEVLKLVYFARSVTPDP